MSKIIDTAQPLTNLTADEKSWVYNGLDCCVTLEVFDKASTYLDDTTRNVYELAKALQGPVLDMNMRGVLVDRHELALAKVDLMQKRDQLEANLNLLLREGYGVDIKWNSPQKLQWFLYNYLRLPIKRKRNAHGGFSRTSDRNALEELGQYMIVTPVINHILLLRDIQKRLGFLETEVDSDGFLRTSYNIAGTTTGRFSSSASDFATGTNTQNIDRRLRRIFIAPTGRKICSLDLSQADSRNVGAMCWQKFAHSHGPAFAGAYLDACESGDLHTSVTRMAWKSLNWGTDESKFRAVANAIAYRDYSYRDLAKRLGHGSNYRGKPPTMAKHTKIPVTIAEDFQRSYFEAFPCIREGHEWTARELKTTATLLTLFGRRRCFFGRLTDEKTLRDAVAYEGQGSTADEANRGMLAVWRGGGQFPGFQLIQQEHDSIKFEYAEECENEIVPWAIKTMQIPLELKLGRQFYVPVEAKVGWNLGDYSNANPDGLLTWKGEDSRQRSIQPRTSFSLT